MAQVQHIFVPLLGLGSVKSIRASRARRKRDMDSDNSKLVFVNKDSTSQSLSRSQGGERAFILSHVQRQRRSRQTGSSKQSPEPWSQFTSRLPIQQQPPAEASSTSQAEDNTLVTLVESPSNNASDPFYCTIAAMDAGNHAMLHFTFSQAAKVTFLAEAFAPASVARSRDAPMRHERAIHNRLKQCIEDKALMYSTLAYGSSCFGWMGGVIEEDRPPEYFIGEALQAVRLRLSEGDVQVDDSLLLSIYGLAITEFWNHVPDLWAARCPERYNEVMSRGHNKESPPARMHLHALLELVNREGGWGKFDPYVLESAILADKYLSLWELKLPVIPLTWNPGPFPPISTDDELGSGFHNAFMTPELLTITQDTVNFIHHAQRVWATPTRALSEQPLFLALQSLQYRLLSVADLPPLDECIRFASLIFLLNATEDHGPQVCATELIPRLRAALVAARFWEETFYWELRLWLIVTGAMTTRASSDREWFRGMAQRLGIESMVIEDVCGIMRRFLFVFEKQKIQMEEFMRTLASHGR